MRTTKASALRFGQSRANSGFTLIELLVATLAFAILLAAVQGTLHGALRLRREATARMVTMQDTVRAMKYLRQDLRNAIYSGGDLANVLVGEALPQVGAVSDRLECFSSTGLIAEDKPWGDLQSVEYLIMDGQTLAALNPRRPAPTNSTERVLVRAIRRNLLSTVEQEPEYEPLLSGVESLDFTFYDGDAWVDTWDTTLMETQAVAEEGTAEGSEESVAEAESTAAEVELPKAIRVRIEFVSTDLATLRRPPLELVIPWTTHPMEFASADTADSSSSSVASGSDNNDGGNNSGPGGGGGGTPRPPSTPGGGR